MNSQIRKTWRNILLMVITASVLAAAIWLLPENATDDTRTFLLPAGMEISEIRIQRGEMEFLLRRADSVKQWEVDSKVGGDGLQQHADEQKMRNLLSALRAPVSQNYPAGEFDLAEVRLDPPMAEVRINGNILLQLGDYTGIDQQRYLRYEQTVHLVSPLLGYYIEQPPEFYVASDNDGQQEPPARN